MEFKKLELRNVLTPDGDKNIIVELVPFDRRNDDHVEFAFNYADMASGAPSPFKTENDAARRFVELFVVHKEADLLNEKSDVSCVRHDLRAARTALHDVDMQKALRDFFMND